MTWIVEKDESNASRRVVEFRTFGSNGTAPDTGSSSSSLRMSIGGNAQFTPNALVSAISANAGMYYLTLNQSDVSQLGNHVLWYEGAFPQHVATVQVVNFNPFSSFSNIAAGTYSGVTVGINNIAPTDYSSAVTVGVGSIKAASYSGVTVGAGDYAAKDMSSALTVGVGIAAPSKVTVQLQSLDYSSKVTTGVGIMAAGVIATAQFGVGAIDNTVIAVAGAQEVADRTLLRNIASGLDGGRTVLSAFRALRNRNDIESGVLTVYQENDTTSAWTATVSTTTGNPVNQIAPSS